MPVERQVELVREFEHNGLSGPQFAATAGLWLMTKRLEQGTFFWPKAVEPGQFKLKPSPEAFSLRTDGVDMHRPTLRPWYEQINTWICRCLYKTHTFRNLYLSTMNTSAAFARPSKYPFLYKKSMQNFGFQCHCTNNMTLKEYLPDDSVVKPEGGRSGNNSDRVCALYKLLYLYYADFDSFSCKYLRLQPARWHHGLDWGNVCYLSFCSAIEEPFLHQTSFDEQGLVCYHSLLLFYSDGANSPRQGDELHTFDKI